MSVQQAAVLGAKSHLGPYAVPHLRGCYQPCAPTARVLKSSLETVIARHSGASTEPLGKAQLKARRIQ